MSRTGRHQSTPAELVDFEWERLAGAHWIDSEFTDGPKRLLVGGDLGGLYAPLKSNETLFLRFAALDDSEEGFAEFACKYGNVPSEPSMSKPTGTFTPDGVPHAWCGYSLERWRRERHLLAEGVCLWDALKSNDVARVFGSMVTTKPSQAPSGEMDVLLLTERWGSPRPDFMGTIPRHAGPARAVQTALASLAYSCVHATVGLAVAPTQRDGSDDVGLRLTYSVSDLREAMWLQLVLAIDGNRRYETCPECGDQWDASGARSDRKTCSDRCRQARKNRLAREAATDSASKSPDTLRPGDRRTAKGGVSGD